MISSDARIDSILCEGHALLAAGRVHDASLAFERVLLHNPDHPEARAALTLARTALAEEGRALDAQLREAQRLMDTGATDEARPLLEEVVLRGGDRDAARALLDRGAASGAAVFALPESAPSLAARRSVSRRRGRRVRSRGLLTVAWAALLLAISAGVFARWDDLLEDLTATPAPLVRTPLSGYVAPGTGERAVAEARALLETGDAEAALQALARVAPDDPAFPFASQLRVQMARKKQVAR